MASIWASDIFNVAITSFLCPCIFYHTRKNESWADIGSGFTAIYKHSISINKIKVYTQTSTLSEYLPKSLFIFSSKFCYSFVVRFQITNKPYEGKITTRPYRSSLWVSSNRITCTNIIFNAWW